MLYLRRWNLLVKLKLRRVIDMTIDEAIEKYKEITNTKAICPGHCNISCDKCLQESKQIAEWLEELKDYQDKNKMVVRVDVENMDSIKDKIEELSKYAERQYNKAIDDFVENISLEISESIIWGMLVNSHKDNSFNDTSDKIVDYVINTANEIAEQLKAGGENGKKKYIELS